MGHEEFVSGGLEGTLMAEVQMMNRETEKLDDILKTYEVRPVTEVRSGIGPLADEVAYRSVRVVLSKHGRPVAALVPIADLAQLHTADRKTFAEMAKEADRSGAFLEEPVDPATLEKMDRALSDLQAKGLLAAGMESALAESMLRCVSPVITHYEALVKRRMAETIASFGLTDDRRQQLQRQVDSGLHEAFHGDIAAHGHSAKPLALDGD